MIEDAAVERFEWAFNEASRLDDVAREHRSIVARTMVVRDACIVGPAFVGLPFVAFVGANFPVWIAFVVIPVLAPMPLVALLVQRRRSRRLAITQDAIVAAYKRGLFDKLPGAPIVDGAIIGKSIFTWHGDALEVGRVGSVESIEREKFLAFYLGLLVLICSLVLLVQYGPGLSGLMPPSLYRTIGCSLLPFLGLGAMIVASLDWTYAWSVDPAARAFMVRRRRFLYSGVVRRYAFDDVAGIRHNGAVVRLYLITGRRLPLMVMPSIDRRHARSDYPIAEAQVALNTWQADRIRQTVHEMICGTSEEPVWSEGLEDEPRSDFEWDESESAE